jgi:hypothetical protein
MREGSPTTRRIVLTGKPFCASQRPACSWQALSSDVEGKVLYLTTTFGYVRPIRFQKPDTQKAKCCA